MKEILNGEINIDTRASAHIALFIRFSSNNKSLNTFCVLCRSDFPHFVP